MCYMVLPIQEGGKSQEEPSKVKPKFRKGTVTSFVLFCKNSFRTQGWEIFYNPYQTVLCDLQGLTKYIKVNPLPCFFLALIS